MPSSGFALLIVGVNVKVSVFNAGDETFSHFGVFALRNHSVV
jgi:hypothetical protein